MAPVLAPPVAAPLLQLALDSPDLPTALGPLQAASSWIDVIEAGTVLCLAEGMGAVRAIRALFPDRTILADLRIAEAGSILAHLAFDAGANWVSVVAAASLTTVAQVCRAARERGGETQVELGETYDPALAARWRELGVEHVIVKRSRDREAAGDLSWGPRDLDRIAELNSMGFRVTITGGLTEADLPLFANAPVGVVIVGRGIARAEDPGAAAASMRRAIDAVWP